MRPRRSVNCVKLLKKFSKLLVHRERADYFHSTRLRAFGVVLVCLRVAEVTNSIAYPIWAIFSFMASSKAFSASDRPVRFRGVEFDITKSPYRKRGNRAYVLGNAGA